MPLHAGRQGPVRLHGDPDVHPGVDGGERQSCGAHAGVDGKGCRVQLLPHKSGVSAMRLFSKYSYSRQMMRRAAAVSNIQVARQ